MSETMDIKTQLSLIQGFVIDVSQNLESDKDSYVTVICEFMREHGVAAIDVSLLKTRVKLMLDGAMSLWHFMGMVKDALTESLGYSKTKH